MLKGERLRELRIERGLSAADAAKELKMSQPQLLNYENGKTDPSTLALSRLITFYGVSADYLLGIVDDMELQKLYPEEVAVISAIRARRWAELLAIISAIIAQGGIKSGGDESGDST